MLSSPKRISADIHRLCRKIGEVETPIFVQVQSRYDSKMNDCFMDVQRQVDDFGGTIQHGWMIWEWPGIFVEGEFHAVWRNPAGELIDVTRKIDGEPSILFAADPKRIFRERRIPNVRLAISRDPRVKQLFTLHDRYQKLLNEVMKDVPFGTQLTLGGEPVEIQMQIARLEHALMMSRDARRAINS